MKAKIILANERAQETIGIGLAAVALIIILAVFAFYYFVVLRGQVEKQSTVPFVSREYAISTTNYLNNLLTLRDEFGIRYSTLIERSIDNPDGKHPSGKTVSNYFKDDVMPKICEWLEQNLGKDNHRFRITSEIEEKHKCGPTPRGEELYTESQSLPLKDNKRVDVTLETWAL